jgi:hypothetical protein
LPRFKKEKKKKNTTAVGFSIIANTCKMPCFYMAETLSQITRLDATARKQQQLVHRTLSCFHICSAHALFRSNAAKRGFNLLIPTVPRCRSRESQHSSYQRILASDIPSETFGARLLSIITVHSANVGNFVYLRVLKLHQNRHYDSGRGCCL